jgi:hypothetical protein
MKEQEIVVIGQLIGNIGFPIFVAYFLLVKHGRAIQELTSAIVELKEMVKSLRDNERKEKK